MGPTQENRQKDEFQQFSAKYRDVSRVRWRYIAATRDVSRLLRRYIAVARDVSRLRRRYIAVYCANFFYYALDFPNSLFLSSKCVLMPLIMILSHKTRSFINCCTKRKRHQEYQKLEAKHAETRLKR